MPKSDPYAGAKLTEQTAVKPPGQDQRLFSPSPAEPSPHGEPKPLPENQEIGKEGSREVGKLPSLPGNRETDPTFDLNEKPFRKDSFLFTAEEWEALEDLKLELRRNLDLRATKNDLARCAIQHLVEDYRQHGDASTVVKKLTKKRIR